MSKHKIRPNSKILTNKALELLRDRAFLFRVSGQIESLGLVGEKRNRLIIFLAILTACFETPVSVLVKGPSSSGKSNLVKTVLQLLPKESVIERASWSAKALVYGNEQLEGKVLFLAEQKGGKDAQLLLRLLQSEGDITHEYSAVRGNDRSTVLARRVGRPVVITTTTEDRIFEDDENRFLSLWVDQSGRQTRAILRAELKASRTCDNKGLQICWEAVRILFQAKVTCEMPEWFEKIINYLPVSVRSRRDWPRFLSLCKAIALTRAYNHHRRPQSRIVVDLADYAIAYRLCNRIFSAAAARMPTQTEQVVEIVRDVFAKTRRPVPLTEIRQRLGWEAGTTYKHVRKAIKLRALSYEPVVRMNNEKRVIPSNISASDFLPSPRQVMADCPELRKCSYVDPITGKAKTIKRQSQ